MNIENRDQETELRNETDSSRGRELVRYRGASIASLKIKPGTHSQFLYLRS